MPTAFLDTNILLRHLRQDHPNFSPRSTAYLQQIEARQTQAHIADTIVFETVYTLQSLYKVPKSEIGQALLPLINLPNIKLAGKRRFEAVFALYVNQNLSFADAYHAVLMQKLKISQIVSFDHGFDRVPWLKRIEP